jgi:ferritin-like metal-binding protein YciE
VSDPNDRDRKLIQYLNEAYGKERELETALEAHIGMTDRAPYKKRLQAHLRETSSMPARSSSGSRSSAAARSRPRP